MYLWWCNVTEHHEMQDKLSYLKYSLTWIIATAPKGSWPSSYSAAPLQITFALVILYSVNNLVSALEILCQILSWNKSE